MLRCEARRPATEGEPAYISNPIHFRRAGFFKGVLKAREEPFQQLLPAPEQHMHVMSLRHSPARLWTIRKDVSFHHRDTGEMVCQHPRRQEASQAAANHHCVSHIILL
jgi:hypothetical protein